MHKICKAFGQVLARVWKDGMLLPVLAAPLLAGAFFRCGIPALVQFLNVKFSFSINITPYQPMLDLLLLVLPPMLFCYVLAMVVLEETDDHVAGYLCVTPLGAGGYLLSRFALPAAAAFVYSLLTSLLFSFGRYTAVFLVSESLLAVLQGLLLCALVIAFSTNKLEGMAVTKLGGLLFLGIPFPYVLVGNMQYLTAFLPTFWMAKAETEKNVWLLLPSLLLSLLWLLPVTRRCKRKLTH